MPIKKFFSELVENGARIAGKPTLSNGRNGNALSARFRITRTHENIIYIVVALDKLQKRTGADFDYRHWGPNGIEVKVTLPRQKRALLQAAREYLTEANSAKVKRTAMPAKR